LNVTVLHHLSDIADPFPAWNQTLQRVLEAADGVTPAARYVVIDTYDGWYHALLPGSDGIGKRS
jgi:hypothetical protein